jgi:glycosyltransferase involved in cell wall biosynthesis
MEVTILTAMPNYPAMQVHQEYKGKWFTKEVIDDIPVYRSWIYVRKTNSIVLRLLNYFSFVFTSIFSGLFLIKKHDFIICESPPLFLGISALTIKLLRRSKIVFNVSDLWPESAEKLGIVKNKFFLKLSHWLEAWLYKRSALVSGQTQGIVKSISSRFPKVKTFWLPNGIDNNQYDENKVTYDWRSKNGFKKSDFIVLYAGILGYAQGLEVILKAAAKINNDAIKFVLVGDGPQKDYLYSLKEKLQLHNVFFFGNQPASEMPNIISAPDAAIVPLKNIPLFKGAIPSKIFESIAFGKPILLGVDGEARELFIDEGKCGLFFKPEDERALANGIIELKENAKLRSELGKNGISYVEEKFNRQKIATAFYQELVKL